MPDASREARDAFAPESRDAGLAIDDAPSTSDAGAVLGSDAPSGGLCPPAGPFGQRVGDVAPDVTLTDCDGNTHSLHALCDREAVWLFELALWCPPCRDFAMSGANRVYDRFRSEAGDAFEGWVVVSEDASFEPATSATCREVRERYGLHAPVLFDTEGLLQSAFGVASNEVQIVLGPGARIGYVGHYGADEVEAEIARVLAE
jgi:peroxiredoxin